MIVASDIDGVIADVRKYVYEYLPRCWGEYFKHTLEFEPIQQNIELLRCLDSQMHDVYFVTGRPESNRELTLQWLTKNLLWTRHLCDQRLHMRPNGNRNSALLVKLEMLDILKPDLVFEDDSEVARGLTEAGYNVIQVHGYRATRNDDIPFGGRK